MTSMPTNDDLESTPELKTYETRQEVSKRNAAKSSLALRVLQEIDLHYLAIAFAISLIVIGMLGPVRKPMTELAFSVIGSLIVNIVVLTLSFIGIAPWGFTKAEILRCLIWNSIHFLAGSILTFGLLSTRVMYSAIIHFL